MKLNSKEARRILEKEKTNTQTDRWIKHLICVGEPAKKYNEHGGVYPHAIL